MRASPAEYNSALRLGDAPSYQFTTTNYQLSNAGCGLMASLAVINCSLLIPPFLPAEYKLVVSLRRCLN